MKRNIEIRDHHIVICDTPEPEEILRGGTLAFDRDQNGNVTVRACDVAVEARTLTAYEWRIVVETMEK